MRSIHLRSSLATLVVAAAALGAAGPASARDVPAGPSTTALSIGGAESAGFVRAPTVLAGRYGDGKLAGARACFMDYTDDSCMG